MGENMLLAGVRRRPRRTRTGRVPLPRVDGRTIAARRFRDLAESYSAEIGGELTEADRSLIQQAAAVQIQCEELQRELVEGRDIDPDMLIRLSSEHRRLLAGLVGKSIKNKPAAGPSIDELFAVDADEAGAE
jgi:hypothetical protein